MYLNPYLFVGLPQQQKKSILRKISIISLDHLFSAIEKSLNITKEQIISNSRKREIVTARYIFLGLQKERGHYITLKKIGELLNRHHATILYAYDSFNGMVETKNKPFNVDLNKVIEELDKS